MNIIPLFKEETRREIEKVNIEIPAEWWSSSYSTSFDDAPKTFSRVAKTNSLQKRDIPSIPNWNPNQGDYRVKESNNVGTKDYVYYRELKLKIFKYSIYPVIVLTVLIILKISSLLSNL